MARGRGGGFRGRAARGRGRGGRGRGRGFDRYGPNRRFDTARLAQDDDDSVSDVEDENVVLDEDLSASASEEDEDDVEKLESRPYMTLLQSLTHHDTSPKAKRRKLAHSGDHDGSHHEEDGGEEVSHDEDNLDQDPDQVDEDEAQADEDHLASELQQDTLEDSDDDENVTDPFVRYYAQPEEETVAQSVKELREGQWSTTRRLVPPFRTTLQHLKSTPDDAPRVSSGLDHLHLKPRLKGTAVTKMKGMDPAQDTLNSFLFNYRDILHCDRNVKNGARLRQSTCLHALNHIFKTRDRVIRNNYRLSQQKEDVDLEYRDQGFTRPKVLFLLPTRNACMKVVNTIRDLYEPDQEENRKRFEESYVDKSTKFDNERPEDFRDLFDGNDDDMFRIGVKFTRKTVKYFAQFYNSDILLASPLGLRMAIGSEEDKKKVDADFLSSIEIVVLDQADALLMQNWEHVEYIFEHLNLQPKDAHGCDFSRVRNWYLEDWAKYFRQNIIMSAFNTPELAELQRSMCHNRAGKVRLQPEYPGMLQQLGVKAKQTFSRFDVPSVEKEPDARFDYFTSAVVRSLAKRAKDADGTLIFVPSYLDFVRLRNYFATSSAVSSVTFGAISEYTETSDASRARSHFLSGRHRVLLYTERAHHFRRYQFSGVKQVLFYGLPDNPLFYKEIAGGNLAKSEQSMMIEPGRGSVRVVFSKYDGMKLERIVGSSRVGRMIRDRGDTFDFV